MYIYIEQFRCGWRKWCASVCDSVGDEARSFGYHNAGGEYLSEEKKNIRFQIEEACSTRTRSSRTHARWFDFGQFRWRVVCCIRFNNSYTFATSVVYSPACKCVDCLYWPTHARLQLGVVKTRAHTHALALTHSIEMASGFRVCVYGDRLWRRRRHRRISPLPASIEQYYTYCAIMIIALINVNYAAAGSSTSRKRSQTRSLYSRRHSLRASASRNANASIRVQPYVPYAAKHKRSRVQ